MKQGQYVRIVKIDRTKNGDIPDDIEHHAFGQGLGALPIGYIMEGTLHKNVEIGHGIHLFRTKRSGPDGVLLDAPGILTTSAINSIEEGLIGTYLYTQNSIYILSSLE